MGIVVLIIYGTAQSKTRKNYCGGSLFRDLVERKTIEISAKSSEGDDIIKKIALEDRQFAKLMGTRQAIKNYNAMINCESYKVDTIFSCLPFEANKTEITFSGCGALNPFQNDPEFIIELLGDDSETLEEILRLMILAHNKFNSTDGDTRWNLVDGNDFQAQAYEKLEDFIEMKKIEIARELGE